MIYGCYQKGLEMYFLHHASGQRHIVSMALVPLICGLVPTSLGTPVYGNCIEWAGKAITSTLEFRVNIGLDLAISFP